MIKKFKNTKYSKNFKRYVLRDTRYMLRGFTLIELLVTISIAAILMVVAIPGFKNYKNYNDLSNTAKIVQSEIYKARSLALAPTTNKLLDSDYYYLDIQGSFAAVGECAGKPSDDATVCDPAKTIKEIERYSLPPTYQLINSDTSTTNQRILFSILKYGKITFPTSNIHLELKNTKTVKSVFITLNYVTGQVIICNDKTTCD
jgi:prepilin-type N-terminal cleavage/methylation domain-containing protein